MKSKERLMKILVCIAAAIIIVFFIAELFTIAGRSYTTKTVYEDTVLETVDARMFVIRDEVLLTNQASGVTVQLAENGERVSKGSEIAAVFPSVEVANNYLQINSLKEKLEVYKKIDNQLKLANIDLSKLNSEIDSEFLSILDSVYDNEYVGVNESKLTFSEKLSSKQISIGETVDCSAKIAQLSDSITALSSVSAPNSIITAEESGFYVGRADGFENIITVKDIDNLTVEMLEKALSAESSEIPDNSIGKIIYGYNWYVATVLDAANTVGFKQGKAVKLLLGESGTDAVRTKVHSVKAIDDRKTLVVFSCNLMNDELASIRKVDGKVIINEYSGLKVPKEALRFDENGNPGVYIRRADIVNFRSLNIVYTAESFVVAVDSDDVELDYKHLKLYDEIIISGKDLKDGMVIG